MPTKSSNPALKNLRGANKEARGRYLGDVARREVAANILKPTEVAGEYDAGRMLGTTLGNGRVRAITHDDLAAFRANVKTAGKQFRGGITAKSVIDLSTADDREKANKEIRTAVPTQSLGGRVHLITNAGPNSDVARHHVHIELLNYSAAISSPAKSSEMAKLLANGPLKFDCDCGRHAFWLRYIATVGRYNAGRDETGYPKIKNPTLAGVACKHVLRVMQQLSSASIRLYLQKMIEKGRGEIQRTSKLLTAQEAREIADRQAKEANWKRNKVESSAERAQRLAHAKAVQSVAKRAVAPVKVAKAQRDFADSARKLAATGFISQSQLDALLANLKM